MSGHHHEYKQDAITRLSRAIGHLEAVKRMVEEERDCAEILVQIAAVRSAVHNVGRMILLEHIQGCVAEAVRTGDEDALDGLSEAVDRFVK